MLLDDYARSCVILQKTAVSDAEGGTKTTWTDDGEQFICFPALNAAVETTKAEKTGLTADFAGMIYKNCGLKYDDYFKDTETGQTFRVTSEPADRQSPGSACLNLKYFTAERKVPPT